MAAAGLGLGAWSVLCDSISKNQELAVSNIVARILERHHFHNSISYGILYEIKVIMNIRRVREDDGVLLREIAVRMYSDSPDAFSETLEEARQRTAEQWDSRAKWLADSPDVIGLIAYDENRPCGFVMGLVGRFINGSMDWQCRDRVTIARTWVDPSARRKGVGKALTDTVKEWAIEKGVKLLELQVTENNEAAKNFYKHLGFTDTGHREPLVSNPQLQIYFLEIKF
jgi:ribosomal protein S18 acetylase RimI-like enzyme